MMKRFVPFAHAKNLFDIDISFFKKFGTKYVLCDLDNTLDSYKTKLPSPRVYEFKQKLQENGIELVIVSNNTGKRVTLYANTLGVRFISKASKPFHRRLLKKLHAANIDIESSMMIGDQTVTDIVSANGAHIRSILTDKLVKEDQPTTRFNRLFDRPIRKRLARKNLLTDWRKL